MRPITTETSIGRAVLTAGLSLVLFIASLLAKAANLTGIIASTLIIGLAVVAAALVWVAGSQARTTVANVG